MNDEREDMQEDMQRNMPQKKKHRWYFYPTLILLIAALVLGGFLGFLTVTEYRPEPVENALSGGTLSQLHPENEILRILSFNLGYGSLGADADFVLDGGTGSGLTDSDTLAANMAGIQQILLENPADIYMLQEIDRDADRTFHINQLERLERVFSAYEWNYAPNFLCKFVPYPLQGPIRQIDSGVATYSRFGVSDAVRISLPVPFSWPVRTANLKRCMLLSRIPLENSEAELVIINFHLEAYDSGEGKQAQTDQLLETVQKEYEAGNYVIAGGDFNQMFPEVKTVIKPTSEWVPGRLDPLPADLQEWKFVYDDSTPTCRLLNQPLEPENERTQFYVIDGFLVSPNVEVLGMETISEGFRFSDHNPVAMQVRLK